MKATFLFCFIFLSIFTFQTIKADSTIVINEALPDALGADGGKEYVELYNNSLQDINLKDWYFVNTSQSGTSKKIIIPDANIKSKSYFVIAEDLTTLNILNGISIGVGKLALYNDFAKLQLFNASAALISEINYGDSKEGISWDLDGPICNQLDYSTLNTPGLVNSKYKAECFNIAIPISYPQPELISINKIEVSVDNVVWTDTLSNFTNTPIYFRYTLNKDIIPDTLVWKDSSGKTLTNPYTFNMDYKGVINLELTYKGQVIKGQSEIIDVKTNISSKVLITEVYPSPDAPDKEWIEIFNNDSKNIDLANYYIEEKTTTGISNNRFKLKNQIIEPSKYYVIYENEFNVSLNNSGDTIYLFDLYGNKIDTFVYAETNKSMSVGRKLENGLFSVDTFGTLTPTPLQDNKFGDTVLTQNSVLPTISIDQLNSLNSGNEFYTEVDIQNFIDKYIFISSGSIKLKAKLTVKPLEDISNTHVKLKAKVFTTSGIKNILINPDDIEILDYLTPEYQTLSNISTLNKDDIGNQISIQGIIKEVYSNRIKIEVNGKLINVYTNDSFNTTDLSKNNIVMVNGTIDYYRNAFRIIETEYSFPKPQVESASTTAPVSYVLPQNNNSILTQDYKEDYSKIYLVTFGYITLGIIFLFEIIKGRKSISKFFKTNLNRFNIINKPVIKY